MLLSTIVLLFFLFLAYALFLLASRKSDARQARLDQRIAEALRDTNRTADEAIQISREDLMAKQCHSQPGFDFPEYRQKAGDNDYAGGLADHCQPSPGVQLCNRCHGGVGSLHGCEWSIRIGNILPGGSDAVSPHRLSNAASDY